MKTSKRLLLVLLAALLLLAVVPAAAATNRTIHADLKLTFHGTTAVCSVEIFGENTSDRIAATMQLKQGSKTIDSWSTSGMGILYMEKTAPVEANKTYTLVVTYAVNGVASPPISIDRTND